MLLLVCKKSAYQIYVREHGSRQVVDLLARDSPAVAHMLPSDEAHSRSIEALATWLDGQGVAYRQVWREDLNDRTGLPAGMELVVAVGGDGTLLDASHHVTDEPIVAVNSDPDRSVGHLCACRSDRATVVLSEILEGRRTPQLRRRMRVMVDDIAVLPPLLNDALIAHPNPAGTSRYRLALGAQQEVQRSGGIWVCTPTGSTGAAASAGGTEMAPEALDLQYVVREAMAPKQGCSRDMVRGMVPPGATFEVQWWARLGRIYADGPRLQQGVRMGQVVRLSAAAPPLRLHR